MGPVRGLYRPLAVFEIDFQTSAHDFFILYLLPTRAHTIAPSHSVTNKKVPVLKTQQIHCFHLSHLLRQTPALHRRSSITQRIAFFIFWFFITDRFAQIRSHVTCAVNDIQPRLFDYRNTSINTYFTCINKYPPLHPTLLRCALCCYGWTFKPPSTRTVNAYLNTLFTLCSCTRLGILLCPSNIHSTIIFLQP